VPEPGTRRADRRALLEEGAELAGARHAPRGGEGPEISSGLKYFSAGGTRARRRCARRARAACCRWSTASRHGDGRTCEKASSIRSSSPSRTSRFGGLDVAVRPRPASTDFADDRKALIDDCPSSILCLANSTLAGENRVHQQILRSGGDLDDAEGLRARDPDIGEEASM